MKLRSAIILKTENRIYPFYYESKNYQQLKSALTNLYYKKYPNVLPI